MRNFSLIIFIIILIYVFKIYKKFSDSNNNDIWYSDYKLYL